MISIVLIYNWQFIPFDHCHLILPPSLPTSGNCKPDLFSYHFIFDLVLIFRIHKWDHTVFVWSNYFCIISSRSIHVAKWQDFFFLWPNHILMSITQFLYPGIHRIWHTDAAFHVLSIMSNAAMDVGVQISLWHSIFIFWIYSQKWNLLDHMVVLSLIFVELL